MDLMANMHRHPSAHWLPGAGAAVPVSTRRSLRSAPITVAPPRPTGHPERRVGALGEDVERLDIA